MRGLFDCAYRLVSINQYRIPLQKLDKVINGEQFRAPMHFGHKNLIYDKRYRRKPLEFQQQLTNTMKPKIRARAEHIFGYMINLINVSLNLRAIGKIRIDLLTALLNLTYNLFRYEKLVRFQQIKAMS